MTKETTPTTKPQTAFGRLHDARRELWHFEAMADERALTPEEGRAWSKVLDEVIFLEDELEERSSCH